MGPDELADFEKRTFRQWDCASLGSTISTVAPTTERRSVALELFDQQTIPAVGPRQSCRDAACDRRATGASLPARVDA